MKTLLLTIAFGVFAMMPSYAQTKKKGNDDKIVEIQPEYPGGIEALYTYLSDNIIYPKDAINANKQGKVYIKFMVDSVGNVRDAIVVRGVSKSIDAEALRVVNAMPTWKPGTQKGIAVNVYFNLPIQFKLK